MNNAKRIKFQIKKVKYENGRISLANMQETHAELRFHLIIQIFLRESNILMPWHQNYDN